MAPLCAALLLALQSQSSPEPIRNWTFQRLEKNPRTGEPEVAALLRGREAVPIDLQRKIFEVRDVEGAYFTEPRDGGPSEKIVVRAEEGRYDDPAKSLSLRGRVRVERQDGTVLEAPAAHADLGTRTLHIPHGFRLWGPLGRLTGEEVIVEDAIRRTTVGRDGFLEILGRAADLGGPPPGPGHPGLREITQLHSRGPLVVLEPHDPADHLTVTARDGVRLDRMDPGGTVTVTARAADILLGRRENFRTGRSVLEPRRLVAWGEVEISGSLFTREAGGIQARADSVDWEYLDYGDGLLDVAVIEGSPLEVRGGSTRVSARTCRIERPEGLATFEGDVSADLAPLGGKDGGAPLKLTARRLDARGAPDGTLREVDASGAVVLEGLGDQGGRAEADRFRWNLADRRGSLEKTPFVRVVQQGSVVEAPQIVLEGTSIVVLKGPKRVRLTPQGSAGAAPEYRLTSDGDVVIDSSGPRTEILIAERSTLQTRDLHVQADRLDVRLGAEGRPPERLRARGNVRIRQLRDGAELYGERLDFDPATQALALTGHPDAVAQMGARTVLAERILFREETDPQTGQKIRTTRMVGGPRGVRLVLDEPDAER
jgi:lipopolysaccharide export system protein LptA